MTHLPYDTRQCVLWVWRAADAAGCERYTYSVASGLIAGGSVATLVTALFNVLALPVLSWGHEA
jgi:hypothetical protein